MTAFDNIKLFTLGPVEMDARTLAIGGSQVPYFRNPEFSQTVFACKDSLLRITKAPEGSDAVFLTASGSGAMEATVMNLFDKRDKLLVIDGGGFGRRFAEICAMHDIPRVSLELSFGEALTRERLEAEKGKGFTGLLINIHETSTGQLYDMELISEFCRSEGLLLVADAISSFLADEIDMSALGIDALIISSHKALALAPGLSFILLSPTVCEERLARVTCSNLYFDFKEYLKNGLRGQTPFTPAVGVIIALKDRLEGIEALGIGEVIRRTEVLATDFRRRIAGLPLRIPGYRLSNACTPIILDGGGAGFVFERLVKEHGICVNPSGGVLADTVLRVGHIGELVLDDNTVLVNALKTVLT